ncbi:PLP-dependent aminotransferase family protein [Salinisphaera sp. LB1]|uniref:aminotransferase-like domain-containing protein n=1 Tax=Salinisphaera sp. LB1 TaxID=2183911 RepID=UPI000D7E2DDD|nr:PLP-dependent aminotransferase family protein [Salinisphaera sp. LB1]AWN14410.1 Transcriptional regulator, GntR family domain [Salinisphaera sp. LB1]
MTGHWVWNSNERLARVGYRYQDLIDCLRRQIDNGALQTGDVLPSVRAMSRRAEVSPGTVLRAYRALEAQGVIESRNRSGFYVAGRRTLSTPAYFYRNLSSARDVDAASLIRTVLSCTAEQATVQFGSAAPAAELLPLSKLQRLSNRTVRQAIQTAHLVTEPQGHRPLRQGIAHHMTTAACAVNPDDIVITHGCTEALMLALRAVTRPGDTVAIESPVYYGIPLILESLGLKVLELPTSPETGVDLNTVAEIAWKRSVQAFVISANHHNPLGFVMADRAKKALVDMLAARQIPLIEDDIYGDLTHARSTRPKPLKAFDTNGSVLYCSSFSKTLSPAYRLGWIVSSRYRETIVKLKMASSLANNGPAQLTLSEFLATGQFLTHLRLLQHRAGVAVQRTLNAINREWPDDVRVNRPSGGILLWIALPDRVDSRDLHRRALELGISIAPGTLFSDRSRFAGHFRLNCAQPWNAATHRGIRQLGKLIDALR